MLETTGPLEVANSTEKRHIDELQCRQLEASGLRDVAGLTHRRHVGGQ